MKQNTLITTLSLLLIALGACVPTGDLPGEIAEGDSSEITRCVQNRCERDDDDEDDNEGEEEDGEEEDGEGDGDDEAPAPEADPQPEPQPEPEPEPEPEAQPEPRPAPEDMELVLYCEDIPEVDCSEPDRNSLRECVEACEEMMDCVEDICPQSVVDAFPVDAVDRCALRCRRDPSLADPDEVEDLRCREMHEGLCRSMPFLGAACGCEGDEPEPQPEPQPEPEPAPGVDCAAACGQLLTCLGDICSANTLNSFGDRITSQCVDTCEDDPAAFASRNGQACGAINAEACDAEPLLGVVCECP